MRPQPTASAVPPTAEDRWSFTYDDQGRLSTLSRGPDGGATTRYLLSYDGAGRLTGYLAGGYFDRDWLILAAVSLPIMALGLFAGGHVHTGKRFVHEVKAGILGQGSGEEDPLLLTARQGRWDMVRAALQPDPRQRLQREADKNRDLYNQLLKRQKETDLTRGLRVNNVFPQEQARAPSSPVSPRVGVNMLIALLLGLLLGVGLAFLVDFLDNSVKTQEQVEQLLRLPLLGILPTIKTSKGRREAAAAAAEEGADA